MTHPRQPTEPAVPQIAIPVAKPPPVWPLWVLAMLPGGFWINLFAGPMMRKRAYKRGFVTPEVADAVSAAGQFIQNGRS